jgi:hypothetical protein
MNAVFSDKYQKKRKRQCLFRARFLSDLSRDLQRVIFEPKGREGATGLRTRFHSIIKARYGPFENHTGFGNMACATFFINYTTHLWFQQII